MASEYTPNYNLDKYVGTDKPNLRDQYNSAMDKIDAQFVVIGNERTETTNQISAINANMTQLGARVTETEGDITNLQGQIGGADTNMTQLGERVTKTEGDIAKLQGQIGSGDTTLAKVKETAENALSLAQANGGDIAANDAEIAQLQTDVQGKAPTSHASSTTEYGGATSTSYGHVKAVDNFRTITNDPSSVLSATGAFRLYGNVRTLADAIMGSIEITPCGEGATSSVKANAFAGMNVCVCTVNGAPVICGISRTGSGSTISGVGVESVSGQNVQLRAVSIEYTSGANQIQFHSSRISITASGISTTAGGGTLMSIYGGCKAVGL